MTALRIIGAAALFSSVIVLFVSECIPTRGRWERDAGEDDAL